MIPRAAPPGLAALLLTPVLLGPGSTAGAQVIEQDRARLAVEWHAVPPAEQPLLLEWIRRSARIVSAYYGQFPVTAVTLQVRGVEGERVRHGRTFADPAPRMELTVGVNAGEAALQGDWILVHEMIHLAAPDLDEQQDWLTEGLAVYVEGIARAQAGNLGIGELWAEYVAEMPRGLPQPGDGGLDHTHTWGRTYWGGALFCLLADVRMRVATGNRVGLQDALRALERAGGGMAVAWPIERVLATLDTASGTTVASELYGEMKDRPVTPDLAKLWADLGIEREEKGVRFDEAAPLAAVRRAITAPRTAADP